MAINQQPDPNNKVPAPVIMAAILGAMLMAFMLWKYKHEEISHVALSVAEFELRIMAAAAKPIAPRYHLKLRRAEIKVAHMDRGSMTPFSLLRVYNQISTIPRAFATVLFVWLSVWAWRRDISRRYRGRQDLDGLIRKYKKRFPAINPASQIDLMGTDPDEGPWARPLGYIEFALRYKIISTVKGKLPKNKKSARYCGRVRTDRLRQVLNGQLGPRFKDINALQEHEKFVFGVFAAAIARKKALSDQALDKANRSCVMNRKTQKVKKIQLGAGLKLADEYVDHELVTELLKKHAHVRVILAKMLALARDRSGVLTTSHFNWLKPVDRTLWYTLHQVGLRVPHCEATGPFAHSEIERLLGEAVVQPAIEPGVRGIILALKGEGWLHMDAKTADGEKTPVPNDEIGVQDALAPSTAGLDMQ